MSARKERYKINTGGCQRFSLLRMSPSFADLILAMFLGWEMLLSCNARLNDFDGFFYLLVRGDPLLFAIQ